MSIGFAFVPTRHHYEKFIRVFLSFSVPFILMTKSYEALFYCSLMFSLTSWVIGETFLRESFVGSGENSPSRFLTISDVRTTVFYLILSYSSFFGVGNEASISSFELSPTLRFVSVFSPFMMMFLLIAKIFIPFILVACAQELISISTNTNAKGGFFTLILLAEVASVTFFYRVKDNGAWAEIGASLSHYAIANFFIFFQLVLFTLSSALLRTKEKKDKIEGKKGK
eukprot:TRINITY_DN15348_c0_g1_i1.p1 TRINITY_DN15348_c0_g1~~TRINITY_DN15348_c0_g1_i1.p1  ORF type:complete len:226 (-),score=41.64 TRINITY_DN15348_c0_g1_i1:32-709(-)